MSLDDDVAAVLRCAAIGRHGDRYQHLAVWQPGCRAHWECRVYDDYCARLTACHVPIERTDGAP